jgi:hypothetical protein
LALILVWCIIYGDFSAQANTTFPVDKFMHVVGHFHVIFFVLAIASNERVALWQNGGFNNSRNVLLLAVSIHYAMWVLRSAVFHDGHLNPAQYVDGTELTRGLEWIVLLWDRWILLSLALLFVNWMFGNDKLVNASLVTLLFSSCFWLVYLIYCGADFGIKPEHVNLSRGINAAMAGMCFNALNKATNGDILGFCKKEIFRYDYSPLKGGLYGLIILLSLKGFILLSGAAKRFPGVDLEAAGLASGLAAQYVQTVGIWFVEFSLHFYFWTRAASAETHKMYVYVAVMFLIAQDYTYLRKLYYYYSDFIN